MIGMTFSSMAPRCNADFDCDEEGTPNGRFWKGNLSEIGADHDAILSHARNRTIRVTESAGQIEIRARDRVGVIGLPSGRRILLRTKIPGVVLLDWLVYIQEFPDLGLWTSGGNVGQSDSWQTVLARLFLNEMEVVTRCHLRKGFVQMTQESSHVRGRMLSNRLSQRPWRLPLIPQVIRGRSFHTPANQMLAKAIDKLVHCQAEFDEVQIRLFNQLRNDWSDISRETLDQHTIIHTSVAAPPDGYRSAVQLARLLLTGASLDPTSGLGGNTFTISLSRIWELAVSRICEDVSSESGWQVAPRSRAIRRWDDSLGPDDPNRSLIADTLLQRGSERWVLDAKYKRSFGNESRNDRFQMCAYVLGFSAKRATLVYPLASDDQPFQRTLMNTSYGDTAVTIEAIALPMNAGPSICRVTLLNHLLSSTLLISDGRKM